MVGGIAGSVAFLISLLSFMREANILAVSGAKEVDATTATGTSSRRWPSPPACPCPRSTSSTTRPHNAFATGRTPHAIVAITTGLRDKLNREELQGVIAHGCPTSATTAITLACSMAVLIGTIAMLADFFLRMMWYGGRGSSSSRDDGKGGKEGGGIVALVLIVIGVILAIIAPIVAQIIQLAVSRQRSTWRTPRPWN
ncbi:MAG: M48 family metalloprotease [Gemmataceae bacterium]